MASNDPSPDKGAGENAKSAEPGQHAKKVAADEDELSKLLDSALDDKGRPLMGDLGLGQQMAQRIEMRQNGTRLDLVDFTDQGETVGRQRAPWRQYRAVPVIGVIHHRQGGVPF